MEKFDKDVRDFRERRDEIDDIYADPELALIAITEKLQPTADADPALGAALIRRSLQTVAYLKSIMPPTSRKEGPFGREVLPSGMAMAEFNRNYEVANDPQVYFDAVEKGDVTKGMGDTFTTIWPELSVEFREKFIEKLGDKDSLDIPFNTKVTMSMALGADVDPLLDASFVLPLQQVITQSTNEEEAQKAAQTNGAAVKPTMTGLSKLDLNRMNMTSSQHVLEQPKPWK
jgi:hypothetical protein